MSKEKLKLQKSEAKYFEFSPEINENINQEKSKDIPVSIWRLLKDE